VEHARSAGSEAIILCAQLEAELRSLSEDDAREYLGEYGMGEPGLQRLVRSGYELLRLITFFTTTGGKIVQAWTVPRGTPAPAAAGRIHTDMERGFIRAEVVHHGDLVSAGSMPAARERGHLRLEGKDYVIEDGDVVHFRFAV
jgi:ribosome-binding ATPase YchF (GTP1/OBG family)